MIKCAVVWIATEPYCSELATSIQSVKQWMPRAERVVLTPDQCRLDAQVHWVQSRRSKDWYLDSITYFQEIFKLPYDQFLYLDTDTVMIANCMDVWQLLDKFDLLYVHAPKRYNTNTYQPVPQCFTEVGVGVNWFNNNDRVRQVFSEWLQHYQDRPEVYQGNDQTALRETLWTTQVPIKSYVLPQEYGCRFGLGGWAMERVRILHGRYAPVRTLEETIAIVNSTNDARTWTLDTFKGKAMTPEQIVKIGECKAE